MVLALSTSVDIADIPEGDCDCDGNQLDALGNVAEIVLRTEFVMT